MSVVYGTAFGGIISENRGGVVSAYVPDPLGNTIGLMNSAGTMTDSWTYWPYGEVRTRSGSNATPFTFCGTLGYFLDTVNKMFYVRARHLRSDLARWPTVDPLWPIESAYAYVNDRPLVWTDPFGFFPCDPPRTKDCMIKCAPLGMKSCDEFYIDWFFFYTIGTRCECYVIPPGPIRKPIPGPPTTISGGTGLSSVGKTVCIATCIAMGIAFDGFDTDSCIKGCGG